MYFFISSPVFFNKNVKVDQVCTRKLIVNFQSVLPKTHKLKAVLEIDDAL